MGYCSYCGENPTDGYWAYYCSDCAMLRRLLKIHDSKKCCEILKRVLIRDDSQIGYKIKNEIKFKEIPKEKPKIEVLDTKMTLRKKN